MLGEEIRRIRLEKEITQKELAKILHITQSELSKIEKGTVLPSAITLFNLSNELGLDIKYFFNFLSASQYDFINGIYKDIRYEVRKKNYKEVFRLIQKQKNTPLYNNFNEYRQFIIWHEGICEYHVNNNLKKALDLLDQALVTRGKNKIYWTENEISILNSMGILYFMEEDYEEAISCYQECLELLDDRPDADEYYKLRIRVLFNLSKAYTRIGDFNESIDICHEVIDICKNHETMYLLAEIYFQLALNYENEDINNYKTYLKKSLEVFTLQGNETYNQQIKKMLNEI